MTNTFKLDKCLNNLKHYLPAQAPLKDFVHHNTLHAFQNIPFFEALQTSNEIFGYKTSLALKEYKELYKQKVISETSLDWVLANQVTEIPKESRKSLAFDLTDTDDYTKRIGQLRGVWKEKLHIDLNTIVHLNLYKLVGSYMDQGISNRMFPTTKKGLLNAVSDIEYNTFFEFFHSKRVKELLFKKQKSINELLEILVGSESYFEQYLIDQQFAHPGWSGMIAVIEKNPNSFFDKKDITFEDYVYLELLLEIDALDKVLGEGKWPSISKLTDHQPIDVFAPVVYALEWEVKKWWQEALELSYFDQVLLGVKKSNDDKQAKTPSFQAFFCIDDREESLRRNIELVDQNCETFGTPAHFNLPIYYRPAGGKFNTQVCPGTISPEHLIIDDRNSEKNRKDFHFHQSSHKWFSGWLISQTMGFWSALKLFLNILKPTVSPAHSSSFEHMSHKSNLVIERLGEEKNNGLKIGFEISEMCELVYAELKRTGLTQNFAPIIYMVGHGGSSTNNPYYAGYNCGACSGRPSSLNARVFASMANKQQVRDFLKQKGIVVPKTTQFLGGMHDTTRDEFAFYDLVLLTPENKSIHVENLKTFQIALSNNAKERARQFISIDIKNSAKKVHKAVKKRSVALFEPRPELNHSNNCLCIVGHRSLTKELFLDQRAFLNSYSWELDSTGDLLLDILNAATPVCGGINLEYYFSRVDNENFGAGSKLPHNVVGLFGVANGIEGDLRTGLPIQMVEVHDPLRLLMIVEQKPDVVLRVLQQNTSTLQWYQNEWVKLAVIDPESKNILLYRNGQFVDYNPLQNTLMNADNLEAIFESSTQNLPVLNLK